MLYVVKKSIGKILKSWDAWQVDAMDQANRFIADNGYTLIESETTISGNMFIYVE